eukprot:superscaffoldBa00002758_g15207
MKVEMMKVLLVYLQTRPTRFHLSVAQSALSETPPFQPSVQTSTLSTALSLLGTLSCNKQLLLAAASKDMSRCSVSLLLGWPPHKPLVRSAAMLTLTLGLPVAQRASGKFSSLGALALGSESMYVFMEF